jgi:uncharacterized repeat protein (TIGR01451 family)
VEIVGSPANVVANQQATATVTNIHPAPGAETEPARLGDYVWLDLNRDGIQDANEPGVSGVTVLLFQVIDGEGVFTGQSTTTDENGFYLFDNLEPGQYYVEFVLPSGYSFTVADAGGDDTVNSKAHVPSLTVTVNSESETVQPGGVMAYTIDYANTGDRPATGVSLSFVVPEHMTFDTVSNPGWVCEDNGQGATICTLEIGTVANGDGGQITIHLDVNSVVADLPVPVNLTVDIWQTTNGVSFVSTLGEGDEDLRHDAGLVQQPAASSGDPIQIVEPPTNLRPSQQPGMGGSIFIPALTSR